MNHPKDHSLFGLGLPYTLVSGWSHCDPWECPASNDLQASQVSPRRSSPWGLEKLRSKSLHRNSGWSLAAEVAGNRLSLQIR